MQSARLTTPKKIKTLHCSSTPIQKGFATFLIGFLALALPALAQDNSPYSRYGIGDLTPSTHINSRGMAGLSAAYNEPLSINFANPASYAFFQSAKEAKSKKLAYGRAILDVGVNTDNRVLREPANSKKFTAYNALFSYVQVGVPLKQNWGLSFGLRPMSRISYSIFNRQRLNDPITGLPIDSATTLFEGRGGSYLASMGTGFAVFTKTDSLGEQKLSVGFNAGYLFGEKDYQSKRFFNNDTVEYLQGNFQNRTNYGNLYFSAGLQYRIPLTRNLLLSAGISGQLAQRLNARQDILRETYTFDDISGQQRLDSVSDIRDQKGKVRLPSGFTAGIMLQKLTVVNKEGGWLLGIDFAQQNWSQYQFYDRPDSVQNRWELKVGAQINPVPRRNYFSNVAYRFGFFTGPDYIRVGQKLPQFGATFGLGLPVATSRQAPNQATIINLAMEYIRRGNNDNLLRENLFRISLGFSLSDFWFIKRKYD